MSLKLLNILNSLRNRDNSTLNEECVSKIDHQVFYQFALIPAVVLTLSFGFTRKRRNILQSLLGGRPGLLFPMDALTRSSRISYACAFGATAFLVYDIVFEQRLVIDTPVDKAAKSFAAILSVLVYGMVFFPVFACLTLSSVFGLVLGAPYVWMLLGVQIYKLTECETTAQARLMMVMQSLPNLLCLLYLSISIPARSLKSLRNRQIFSWTDSTDNSLDNIKESYDGYHVRKLFRKPKVKKPVIGKTAAIKAAAKRLVSQYIYRRKKGFRYPARMLSVMLVGLMVVYILVFELAAGGTSLIQAVELQFADIVQPLGWEEQPGEDEWTTILIVIVLGLLEVLRISFLVALGLASLFCVLNVLHSLTSYRTNLLALYRGDHSHIPPPDPGSSVSYCVNSIKYGGFQVGYIVWGFFVQFGLLVLICFALGLFVQLIILGYYEWMISLLEYVWPVVLVTGVIMTTQILLAKFVFLQNRGAHVALDNRYCYFIFTYFMFFYNIFLGLVSCLLRIVKAIVLGIAFLGRLDHSTLSRKFEFWDPGFSAYRGFIHMEYAHTHPVVIVFVRLVIDTWEAAKETEISTNPSTAASSRTLVLNISLDNISVLNNGKRRRSMKARCNWHVAYTLLHNPALRVTRKGFMQLLRQAREVGVRIPISDNQADIDTELLAQQILQAREEAKGPDSKKTAQPAASGTTCKL